MSYQITADKCGDAPSGNCADPEYNIKTAANYFASTLASYNGDLLQALGTYNGWYSGMTYNNAIAIKVRHRLFSHLWADR